MDLITDQTSVPFSLPKVLEGLTVLTPQGNPVAVAEYYRNNTMVLKILRRFGCSLCRYECKILSELKPELDIIGVKLVAIGYEQEGVKDFINSGFWNSDVLIDVERAVHLALGVKKLPLAEGFYDIFKTSTISGFLASRRAGISSDLKGDMLQLGATFVIEKGTGKILYEHHQNSAGSYASLKDVFSACGGDPNEIDEVAPEACIKFSNDCKDKCHSFTAIMKTTMCRV